MYYYHFDGLGSVVALSDVNSVLVERYTYDVFGRPTIRDANGVVIEESAFDNPYLFTARAYDAESGLYYYRARYYDYYTGRFLLPDPIGYRDGLNLYSYVGSNPVNRVDPLGLIINPEGLQEGEWDKARTRLMATSRGEQIIKALEGDDRTFYVWTNSHGWTWSEPKAADDGTIGTHWDPYIGSVGAGHGQQSPTLKLYHELEHLYDWQQHGGRRTLTEMDIIQGLEAEMARVLGDDPRPDHYGTDYRVVSPNSTEPKDPEEFRMALEKATYYQNECIAKQIARIVMLML